MRTLYWAKNNRNKTKKQEMKKTVFSFTALLILTATSAFAESTSYVATKQYVDAGLNAVYTRAKNRDTALQNDVDELTIYVGAPSVGDTPATGLTKQIEEISTTVENLRNDIVYTGNHNGVNVTDDRTVEITGLSPATGTNNRVYVFRNNTATELEIADTWTMGAVASTAPATTPTTPGTGE